MFCVYLFKSAVVVFVPSNKYIKHPFNWISFRLLHLSSTLCASQQLYASAFCRLQLRQAAGRNALSKAVGRAT